MSAYVTTSAEDRRAERLTPAKFRLKSSTRPRGLTNVRKGCVLLPIYPQMLILEADAITNRIASK